MKIRRFVGLALMAMLAINSIAAIPVHIQSILSPHLPSSIPTTTLQLSLTSDPVLDPALAAGSESASVIEQLFIGLFDFDDESGSPQPELAASWNVSTDGLIYYFTLRDDIYWTDGAPVTAFDVRYGILRTLNPETRSIYAYPLFIIVNAQSYNEGELTNPNKVGVEAPDATHLTIILHEQAAYLPSILGLWIARPMPQSAIETWGEAWAEPDHIVTSGAYKLSEWVHDDHLTLEKNPEYYDAPNVQIQQVKISVTNEPTLAWSKYQSGLLDTAPVPLEVLHKMDPITRQEYHRGFGDCSYYYGFTNNKPPFDDVRVRKAFIMAVDKQALVRDVLKGGQYPASQFAPPGIFGAPPIGSVGLDYNPSAARALLQDYLAEKGMDLQDFNALEITLMHNTSEWHAMIAAAMQQMWADTLGVHVTVKNQEWAVYLYTIQNTTPLEQVPHIWRLGWCTDYPDETNWVYEVFNNQAGFNPSRRGCLDPNCSQTAPLQFEQITAAAKVEQDPEIRRNLYIKAELLLAEEEAAYLPLYFYSSNHAAKLYLQRTYPTFGGFDIANWRLTRVGTTIKPDGGSLRSYDGQTIIHLPAGAISETISLTHTPTAASLPDGDLVGVGQAFDMSARYLSSGRPAQILPGSTISITIQYSDEQKGSAIESTLGLYYWEGQRWVREPSSSLDNQANTVKAAPDHFSLWRLLGETKRSFLPLVKN